MAITKLSVSTVKNGLLKSNKIWDQTSTYSNVATNSYFPIASYTVPSGGVSSIVFAGIPQTYSHLQIRMTTVTSAGGGGGTATYMELNGDTTVTNYKSHAVEGYGTAVAAYAYSLPLMPWGVGVAATTGPGASVIDVLDYKDTNKYKTVRALGGYDANGTGYVSLSSMLWMNTSAITSINFNRAGTTWAANMNVSIFGVN
jgi:hypothetical protein